MAFPFTEVPVSIKDYLVEMVRESIEEVDATIEIETGVMSKKELKKFLAFEKEKGKSKH